MILILFILALIAVPILLARRGASLATLFLSVALLHLALAPSLPLIRTFTTNGFETVFLLPRPAPPDGEVWFGRDTFPAIYLFWASPYYATLTAVGWALAAAVAAALAHAEALFYSRAARFLFWVVLTALAGLYAARIWLEGTPALWLDLETVQARPIPGNDLARAAAILGNTAIAGLVLLALAALWRRFRRGERA